MGWEKDGGSLHTRWKTKMKSDFAMLCWYGAGRQIEGEEDAITSR